MGTVRIFSRLSHWVVKLRTKSPDRGSASSRSTCRAITAGSSNFPAAAKASSSSSGMLPQRKYESLEAGSYRRNSGWVPPPAVW